MTKECKKCHQTKSINRFTKDKRYESGYTNTCSKCVNLYNSEWKKIPCNNIKIKAYQKKYDKKRYIANHYLQNKVVIEWTREKVTGFTPDEYDAKYIEQEGCCAVCGKSHNELKRALSADHNHNSGQKRGLLCSRCNLIYDWYEEHKNKIEKYYNKYLMQAMVAQGSK